MMALWEVKRGRCLLIWFLSFLRELMWALGWLLAHLRICSEDGGAKTLISSEAARWVILLLLCFCSV